MLAITTAGWDHADAARAGARAPAKATTHATAAKGAKGRHAAHKRPIHGPNYHPPYAAIVVDDNSGQVLHEENADEPRHPASLTKIMTLYLLFEQIEAGKFKLDTPLSISAFAASQNPTKLNLKANQTILVEDAIKGLVTKSANDAAVVVAEAIGGTEADFGGLMTAKARALGMAGTTYVNASGLPADEQITTARDQALLGRAIQDRFPVYYSRRRVSTTRAASTTITMPCLETSRASTGSRPVTPKRPDTTSWRRSAATANTSSRWCWAGRRMRNATPACAI
jgi:D-alanyl-D-alanine carboxypeptidase